MSKKRPRPERIKAGDTWYQVVVMLIHSKDEKGRPKLATCIHDDQKIELAGGEEFMTVYIPLVMLKE